jgi:hypothetical protein
MPRIIETVVYCLEELSDSARENARNWYREGGLDDEWFDSVFEDFAQICETLGVRLKTQAVSLMGGGTRQKPRIWFSGFWSQGDGACFEASYSYRKDAPRAIRSHAPQDAELHAVADAIQAIQRRNFYQLHADISHRGHYHHEFSMEIFVERDSPTYQSMTDDAEETLVDALRYLARWLYRQLRAEYEYLTSDEVVDEVITANADTFTESGRRFG